MAAFFSNLRNTVIVGILLAVLMFVLYVEIQGFDAASFWPFFVRWLHVLSGVMWIGLLWYFNFVSAPTTPQIPAELRPALGKYITPAALFWFRWAAMSTIVFGIILAQLNGYLGHAYLLDSDEGFADPKAISIGIGMWLGTIMWFNVWFIIWPNQQKALNIGDRFASLSADDKAAAARTAGTYSRINTMLSIPMLFAMVAAQNIY
ncbi:MAG: urate hydroxylase PuuD [Alphaproteobacteria bacterium]|nr:urate hydroxylase PuuD [Alphaproteobacteria bacterium]